MIAFIGILLFYCIPIIMQLFGLMNAAFWTFFVAVSVGALAIVMCTMFLSCAKKDKNGIQAFRATALLAYNSAGVLTCIIAADLLKII